MGSERIDSSRGRIPGSWTRRSSACKRGISTGSPIRSSSTLAPPDSFKENRFGEANVQLTFHGDDRKVVDGVTCIMVEPDIDYYRDLGSHGLLEVLPGFFPGGMTDPRVVYLLRWMAGRRKSGIAEFDPPYTLDKVGD